MKKEEGTIRSYFVGFVISLLLTLASFGVYLVNQAPGLVPSEIAVALVICFAVFQLFVQLVFFLHIGHEEGSRWNLIFFVSTVSIILLVVLSSIWIMYHLNYNMTPTQMEEYLLWKEGIH